MTTSYAGAGDLNSAPCASAARTLLSESWPKPQKSVKCSNMVSWGLRDRAWISPCLRELTFYPLCLLRRSSAGVIDARPWHETTVSEKTKCVNQSKGCRGVLVCFIRSSAVKTSAAWRMWGDIGEGLRKPRTSRRPRSPSKFLSRERHCLCGKTPMPAERCSLCILKPFSVQWWFKWGSGTETRYLGF